MVEEKLLRAVFLEEEISPKEDQSFISGLDLSQNSKTVD